MTRISLDPTLLRGYTAHAADPRDDVSDRVAELGAALADLEAALPGAVGGLVAPTAPDTDAAVLKATATDDHVAAVAAVFEDADQHGPDGLPIVDDATLTAALPVPDLYTEEQREALRLQAEEELASLRERIAAGDVDDTTTDALMGTLGLLNHVVETSADPQAAAAALVETMGPGDMYEALRLLDAEASTEGDRLGHDSPAVTAIADLASVTSLGLEDDPERAARWADDLATRGITHEETGARGSTVTTVERPHLDALVVLAASVAPGTGTLGTAIFDRLHGPGPYPGEGGVVDRLYGGAGGLTPILERAAGEPELANGIVDSLLDDTPDREGDGSPLQRAGIDTVFSPGRDDIHEFPGLSDETLRDVLVASVDPSLDPVERGTTAYHLAEQHAAVLDSRPPVPRGPYAGPQEYGDTVVEGFAAATQPLLEGWTSTGEAEVWLLPSDGGAPVALADDVLWDAVGAYGERGSGVDGLLHAVGGATSMRVLQAYDIGLADPESAGHTAPLDLSRLTALGDLQGWVAANVNSERFTSLVEAAEAPAGPSAVVTSILTGVIGEAPGGSSLGGVINALQALEGRGVTGGGNALAGAEVRTVVDMALLDLAARPDLATPEVLTQLEEAAGARGETGIYSLLTNNVHPPPEAISPALRELRNLVLAQSEAVDTAEANALGESTSSPGDG